MYILSCTKRIVKNVLEIGELLFFFPNNVHSHFLFFFFLFQNHVKQHKEEDGQFKCTFCNIDLKEKSALDEHLQMHGDLSPLHCVICKKLFQKKGGLVRHMRIHVIFDLNTTFKQILLVLFHTQSGLHFYQCHRCGKGFVHKSSFEMHMMAHDDIRKKKCPHCDQMFRSTSHLNRHLRIHVICLFV